MIELRQDQAVSFSWYDGGGLVPASVTAQLIDRKGGVLATGSVTLPSASTTVHGQHAAYFDVVDSTGIVAGGHLSITSDTVTYVREVLRRDNGTHDRVYLRTDIPESLNAGIERLVAAKLHSLLEPMQRQHQAQQARASYEGFMEAHPELRTDTELRAEVRAELERNQALDLETAYWAVKGRRLQGKAAQEEADKARRRRALQAAGARMAGGTHVAESVAKVDRATRERGDAWSIYSQLSRKG